jgi:hypothetical protein
MGGTAAKQAKSAALRKSNFTAEIKFFRDVKRPAKIKLSFCADSKSVAAEIIL